MIRLRCARQNERGNRSSNIVDWLELQPEVEPSTRELLKKARFRQDGGRRWRDGGRPWGGWRWWRDMSILKVGLGFDL